MIDKFFRSVLISICCLCAKFLFKHVAIYTPDKEKDEVVSIVFSNDDEHIKHMCEFEGAKKDKEVFKP